MENMSRKSADRSFYWELFYTILVHKGNDYSMTCNSPKNIHAYER